MRRLLLVAVASALCAAGAPATATAAPEKTCAEPGATWPTATPAEVGMDAAKLQSAIDYGTANLGFAVRVYRHGCLVGQDRAAAVNDATPFESWSMAKSTISLLFGRAMTLGLISPDDPVGALVPQADQAHGAVTMRQLLTMTSGLQWNGIRDYNIFTDPDRVHDALTLPFAHPPGTYFEYAQSAISLLAEAIGQAVGDDIQTWGQRELFDKIGIPASAWRMERDPAGHVQGFTGVDMRPGDFAREGDLLRLHGVWNGQRLLSAAYVRDAIAPTATNGCYGWLIWLNAAKPCIEPTITSRPYTDAREFPDLPADLYSFEGLFGQIVTILPTQDIEVVRLGTDSSLLLSGGSSWEHDLYAKILASVTDQTIVPPAGAVPTAPAAQDTDVDYGFQTALLHPEQYSQSVVQDPLGPPGPERARALQLWLAHSAASRTGGVTVRAWCPARQPGHAPAACTGRATLTQATKAVAFDIRPGATTVLRFRLTATALRALRSAGTAALTAGATTADAAGGTATSVPVTLHAPAS